MVGFLFLQIRWLGQGGFNDRIRNLKVVRWNIGCARWTFKWSSKQKHFGNRVLRVTMSRSHGSGPPIPP